MKVKLQFLLPLIMMLAMAGCSDSDDDEETVIPLYKDSHVSRVKVFDVNNPGSDPKTIKIYYDNEKRVTGVHWGSTVPNRLAWKFVYGADRIEMQTSADVPGTKRYFALDASGRVCGITYETDVLKSSSEYSYADELLSRVSEDVVAADGGYNVSSDFSWSSGVLSDVVTRVGDNGRDSLIVTSKMRYDELAPNNTNLDINALLDALNGIFPRYAEAPVLLRKCGMVSPLLLMKHTQSITDAAASGTTDTHGYIVLSYSMQQGRIDSIETLDEESGKHLKINFIYKSDK